MCGATGLAPQITGDGNLQTLPGILAVGFPPVRKKPLSLSLSLSLALALACLLACLLGLALEQPSAVALRQAGGRVGGRRAPRSHSAGQRRGLSECQQMSCRHSASSLGSSEATETADSSRSGRAVSGGQQLVVE